MSFFDEDDEPLRTTSRARSRSKPRSKPRPRRGSPAGGGSGDAQAVLVRRMIAGIVGLVILLMLFFLVRACNTTRHENALKDYNRQVSGIAVQSRQTAAAFFKLFARTAGQSPTELQSSILGYRESAETALKQAQNLSTPDDMRAAQQSLLIALELRRDGLASIAEQIRPSLGDAGEAADRAIRKMAAQMRAFDASDVLYEARVIPLIKRALNDSEIGGQKIEPSPFLRDISWLSPQFVATKLGQQLASSGTGATPRNETTGPGLHGTGLNATSYGTVTLQPTASNRLTYVAGQAFTVAFTNQGDNDEFNIKVTLRIVRDSGGAPVTISKTVARVAKGEKATVQLPLNRTPPLDTVVRIEVVVAAVPGEKKTDNNKSSYPSLFVRG